MAKDIWSVCSFVEKYKSTYNGKDWTDPKHNAWSNFPWEDLSLSQKQYIKTLWNFWNKEFKDPGKFIFFDIINLAPTSGENYGYQTKQILNTRKDFFVNIPIPIDQQTKKRAHEYVPSGVFKQLQSQQKNSNGKKTESEIQGIILNNVKIDENDIEHPAESEFKLSWMRDLVERGVEGVMGPFVASLKSDGSPNKTSDGRVTFKIDQNSLDRFINNRNDYKKAIWEDWLQSQLDFATKDPKGYNNSPYPKVSLKDLQTLSKDGKLSEDGKEQFVMTEVISGQLTSNTKGKEVFQKLALGANGEPIFRDGVMAKVNPNYTISGWIKIPGIYGDKQLPWPFVWRYIGRGGIWQKSVWETSGGKGTFMPSGVSVVEKIDIDAKKQNSKNIPSHVPYIANGTGPSYSFLAFDARSRFWHHRYSTKEIPQRELLFLIRYKYGAAGAVGERFVAAYADPPAFRNTSRVTDEVDNIKQCGGIPLEGVTIKTKSGVSRKYQPYNGNEFTKDTIFDEKKIYRLRSKYICQIHDAVGWNRFGGGDSGHVLPGRTDLGTPLKGEAFEIVDFDKEQGYYSFNGGTSDRQPIQEGVTDVTDDYKLYEYKRDFKLDVQKNHISLWRLINLSNSENPTGLVDPNDRFVTSDSIISTNEIKTTYYNHAKDYLFNYQNAFYPGLYTNKELQFLYELVSYVYYGRASNYANGVYQFDSIFSFPKRQNKHRWAELGATNSIFPIPNPDLFPKDQKPLIDIGDSDTYIPYLMDYILWAAPTNEQFRKVKFSTIEDTFVKRYKDILINSGKNWIDIRSYPVHLFAKQILDSESSSNPTVPAWVHYKYISRTLNYGENGINAELIDNDVYRVFGGKRDTDDIDQGKLIALPMFVLGGRPDIKNDEKWDSSWGPNPFKIENGVLTVGNMDSVLDNWAKKERLHNGKYVSAMEILFWLRYKRGLSSAPAQRTIRYPINKDYKKINYKWTIDSKNYWPKEAFIYSESINTFTVSRETIGKDGEREILEDGDILPTETLHNIPILTSYYHPIYSDGGADEGVLFKNADPLMDFETQQKIKGMEITAYTGWNSKYVAHWNGAMEIPKDSLLSPPVSAYFSDQYPSSTSKLNQVHTKPFKKVHDFYISNQNGKKYDSSKGLLYGFSINKLINTSDIQAWFRAIKMLAIHDSYARYISEGITKQEGDNGSVIPVKAEIVNTTNKNEPKNTIIFISGEPIGNRYSPSEDFKMENILHRPWEGVFEGQPELNALLDDYSLGTKNCTPQYRYMRHIIQPLDFMYFFPKTKENPKGWYSDEQSYKTLKWMIRMIPTKSYTGFGVDTFNKMDKLSLRALILGGCVSNNVGKTLLKSPKNFGIKTTNELNVVFQAAYKGVWGAGKFGKVIWTASAISTKIKTIGGAYFESIGKEELSVRAKNLEDFFKYKLDYPLTFGKWGLKLLNDIRNGEFDEGSITYFIKEGVIKFYGDIVKDISKHAFQEAIEELVSERKLSNSLQLARLGSFANLGLVMLYELISWQIDLAIENYKGEKKIEDMWALLNEATKNNWVEGPYMESKGTIRIPKGSDGTIAGNYDPKELENQGIKNIPAQTPSSNGFWEGPVPEIDLIEFVNFHNNKFYKPNGLAKTIGKNLKEGSCECQFLTSLFAETPTFKSDSNYRVEDKGTPFDRKNWKKGPFIRQWLEREKIIDDAPTYSDIPITFAKAERPDYRVNNLVFDRPSTQISDLQQPGWGAGSLGRSNNIRVNGQGGTVAVSMADCPRFWWPNILHVPTSDDLCQYMAIDGKYPSRMPETYGLCDGLTKQDLQNKIALERNRKSNYNLGDNQLRRYSRSGTKLLKTDILYYPVDRSSNTDIGNLHTEYNNDADTRNKVFMGNTIVSLQGVDGIAPPHEREIVRLFRMKYGIDIVFPNNNCCSIGEVLEENTSAGSASANNLQNRQNDATKCEYIIKLNDERFHKIVKESCIKNKTQDNSQENVNRELANNTTNNIRKPDIRVIDSAVISGSIQLSMDSSLIGGGWPDNRRKKKSRRKNPCVPGCVDCCDEDRPIPPGVEVSERQIAITNVDTTFANSPSANLNRYQAINNTMGILENIGNSFSSIIGGIRGYFTEEVKEPRSTPLGPADSEKSKKYRDSLKKKRSETQPQQSNETLTQPNTNTTNTG